MCFEYFVNRVNVSIIRCFIRNIKNNEIYHKYMKICKTCIQPDTRPGIFFNENDICGACLWADEKTK